jgi:RNA polymerase sigma-70 factor (ECF subfamily)
MEGPDGSAEQANPEGLDIPDWGDLVARIRDGDNAAMETLYAFFEKGVRWFFYRALGREELEDRVHDCFMIVTKAIRAGDLRDPERLMGYVRTVVRRQIAANIHDVSTKRRTHVDFSESTFAIADWKADPEQSLASREREALGKKVLAEISEKDREVLMRFYVEEQDYGTICKEMNLTYNQFRLLKSRAKARFGKLGKRMAESSGAGGAKSAGASK